MLLFGGHLNSNKYTYWLLLVFLVTLVVTFIGITTHNVKKPYVDALYIFDKDINIKAIVDKNINHARYHVINMTKTILTNIKIIIPANASYSVPGNIIINGSSYSWYDKVFSQINNSNLDLFIANNKPNGIFPYGFIYNFLNTSIISSNNKIAIVLLNIGGHSKKTHIGAHLFYDIRMKKLRIANFIDFAKQNSFLGVILTKRIYTYPFGNHALANHINSHATYQKAFVIKYIFKHYAADIDWVFYLDFDGIFAHCNHDNQIQNKILNKYGTKSLIFSGDKLFLNAGVFAIKNDKYGLDFLDKFVYIINNSQKFQLLHLEQPGFTDQKIFAALITGFDPYKQGKDELNKRILSTGKNWKRILPQYNINDGDYKEWFVRIPERIFNMRPKFLKTNENILKNQEIIFWHFAGEQKRTHMIVSDKDHILQTIITHTIRQCKENFINLYGGYDTLKIRNIAYRNPYKSKSNIHHGIIKKT